jgi:hypothetical protein
VNVLGVALLIFFGALIVATALAVLRFRRGGGTNEDLRQAEETLKFYEQAPGG